MINNENWLRYERYINIHMCDWSITFFACIRPKLSLNCCSKRTTSRKESLSKSSPTKLLFNLIHTTVNDLIINHTPYQSINEEIRTRWIHWVISPLQSLEFLSVLEQLIVCLMITCGAGVFYCIIIVTLQTITKIKKKQMTPLILPDINF